MVTTVIVVNFIIFYGRSNSMAAFLFSIYNFMLWSSIEILIEKVVKRIYGSDRGRGIIVLKL
jgi:hypothetical protein